MAAGRRRRRAVFVSDVDRELVERGLPPSWEDKVGGGDLERGGLGHTGIDEDVPAGADGSSDRGDGANDARLEDNVPPHSQART